MNIKKISRDSSQDFMRFDKEARVEIFMEEWEIESDDRCAKVILDKNMTNEQKIVAIKELCAEIAYGKLREAMSGSGIQITLDGLSSNDIDIDKIRWGEVLNPDNVI
jgi:hypothetical protein